MVTVTVVDKPKRRKKTSRELLNLDRSPIDKALDVTRKSTLETPTEAATIDRTISRKRSGAGASVDTRRSIAPEVEAQEKFTKIQTPEAGRPLTATAPPRKKFLTTEPRRQERGVFTIREEEFMDLRQKGFGVPTAFPTFRTEADLTPSRGLLIGAAAGGLQLPTTLPTRTQTEATQRAGQIQVESFRALVQDPSLTETAARARGRQEAETFLKLRTPRQVIGSRFLEVGVGGAATTIGIAEGALDIGLGFRQLKLTGEEEFGLTGFKTKRARFGGIASDITGQQRGLGSALGTAAVLTPIVGLGASQIATTSAQVGFAQGLRQTALQASPFKIRPGTFGPLETQASIESLRFKSAVAPTGTKGISQLAGRGVTPTGKDITFAGRPVTLDSTLTTRQGGGVSLTRADSVISAGGVRFDPSAQFTDFTRFIGAKGVIAGRSGADVNVFTGIKELSSFGTFGGLGFAKPTFNLAIPTETRLGGLVAGRGTTTLDIFPRSQFQDVGRIGGISSRQIGDTRLFATGKAGSRITIGDEGARQTFTLRTQDVRVFGGELITPRTGDSISAFTPSTTKGAFKPLITRPSIQDSFLATESSLRGISTILPKTTTTSSVLSLSEVPPIITGGTLQSSFQRGSQLQLPRAPQVSGGPLLIPRTRDFIEEGLIKDVSVPPITIVDTPTITRTRGRGRAVVVPVVRQETTPRTGQDFVPRTFVIPKLGQQEELGDPDPFIPRPTFGGGRPSDFDFFGGGGFVPLPIPKRAFPSLSKKQLSPFRPSIPPRIAPSLTGQVLFDIGDITGDLDLGSRLGGVGILPGSLRLVPKRFKKKSKKKRKKKK